MTTTFFTDTTTTVPGTTVVASWLNDVNAKTYTATPITATTINASGASVLQNVSATNVDIPSINSGQLSGFRNKIINGDMMVSQVNGTTVVTPVQGQYPIDQWQCVLTQASKYTVAQVADAPPGLKYSCKINQPNASPYAAVAADYFAITQPIEGQNLIDLGFGTAAPATIAISLWVKSSAGAVGTYSISVNNGTRSYVGTVPVTASWAKQTVVLVGDLSGTWATDNTYGLVLCIDLGSGSNYNATAGSWNSAFLRKTAGSVSFVGLAQNNTLQFTGVQLEQVSVGATQGTAFEHVPYETQLRWCQRYLPVFNSTSTQCGICSCSHDTTTDSLGTVIFKVPTRVPVTGIVISSAAHFRVIDTAARNTSAVNFYVGGSDSAKIAMTISATTAGFGGGMEFISASGQLYFTGAQM